MGADETYTLKQAQEDFAAPAMGRPKAMTPEVLYERFVEYRDHTKSHPFEVHDFVGKDGYEAYRKREKCLTIEGFENYLEDLYGIGQIQQYLENRDKAYNDYVDQVKRIKRIIREDQISGGMAGVYHHNLTARLQGLKETIETPGDNVKLLNIDPL